MRSYKQSYDGFVCALWQALGETTGGGDLGNLLTALEKRQQQVIFWLHDFDALLDNPDIDPRYNLQFTDSLNSTSPLVAGVCDFEVLSEVCICHRRKTVRVTFGFDC